MTGEAGAGRARARFLSCAGPYLLVGALLLGGGIGLGIADLDRLNSLSAILAAAAVIAGFMAVGPRGGPTISSAFIVALLAAAFLGPLSAAVAAILSEAAAAARRPNPLR